MSTKHIVTAGAVIVGIGHEGEKPMPVTVYRGEYLPLGVIDSDIEHCLRLGLIAAEDVAEVELSEAHVVEGRVVETVTVPSGEPKKAWSLPELKQYAANRSVDLGEATTKDDILVVLADAAQAEQAEAERQRAADAQAQA